MARGMSFSRGNGAVFSGALAGIGGFGCWAWMVFMGVGRRWRLLMGICLWGDAPAFALPRMGRDFFVFVAFLGWGGIG